MLTTARRDWPYCIQHTEYTVFQHTEYTVFHHMRHHTGRSICSNRGSVGTCTEFRFPDSPAQHRRRRGPGAGQGYLAGYLGRIWRAIWGVFGRLSGGLSGGLSGAYLEGYLEEDNQGDYFLGGEITHYQQTSHRLTHIPRSFP